MKVRTASGKKPRHEVHEERNNVDPVTPRMKKSYSVTKTSYLQLQLDASGKKRGNLERNLQGKDKRINELQKEVREYQEVIVATGVQMRELKGKYQQEKVRGERAQGQLKEAVQLCREMNQKYHELFQRNQVLKANEAEWMRRAAAEEKKLKDLKQLRRKEKREIKELVMKMLSLPSLAGASSQQIQKLSQML